MAMTTEMSVDRVVSPDETAPVRGLGLAPVRAGYHRWPEDACRVRDEGDAPVIQALCLVLGQLAWRKG
jgi:hypothetical protein